MPLSSTALKKREAARKAKEGIPDDKAVRKAATAKEEVKCAICLSPFKVTAKNSDQKVHAETKHPKSSFAAASPVSSAHDDGRALLPLTACMDAWMHG
eukprot:CAMPEP_0204566740 /NCGR_PEP_ID=MMETSP0661-20131031/36214_1 /ASSEMBLY_ACC=CAM_ASM_000606 /TAXON_ID=109239 /ORGANISM="Alexandrium margalefi, Strain AMGDE01CS-322" /LENGTH=97 /DNA_ID=CAMNT_0051574601 /DNA_START=70 /DNA_END=361 /DNA_ORIENTATION=+